MIPRPRIILAEDHQLLREAFTKILEPDCDVLAAVSDGQALVAATQHLLPDVVIVDVTMPVLNGLEAARQLQASHPSTKIIFLTMNEDPEIAAAAFRAGASAFILKNSAASELLQAIREVQAGRSYVTPLATRGLIDSLLRNNSVITRSVELSPRQREVLKLISEGLTMKEIARRLKITPRTVAFHKYSMMEMLGIRSSAELIRFASKEFETTEK